MFYKADTGESMKEDKRLELNSKNAKVDNFCPLKITDSKNNSGTIEILTRCSD